MSLTQLPYEVEETILQYLPYTDVINYFKSNTRDTNVRDNFFKRRAKLDNIPLDLLPESNVAARYIQLFEHRLCLETNKLSTCLMEPIDNNDIEEIKWLISLLKNIEYPLHFHPKTTSLIYSSMYAFQKNNDMIGEWLLSNLYDFYQNKSIVTLDFDEKTLFKKIIYDSIHKNKLDITYFIVDELYYFIPELKKLAFSMFARYDQSEGLIDIIKDYYLSINDYDDALFNTNSPYIFELLLQKYPGDERDLNRIFGDPRRYYTTKDNLAVLFNYGADNYNAILFNIVTHDPPREDSPRYKANTYEDVQWLLLNYGHNIQTNYISSMIDMTRDSEIKKILSHYLTQR